LRSANERPRVGTEGAVKSINHLHHTTAPIATPTPCEAVGYRRPDSDPSLVKSAVRPAGWIEPLLSVADLVRILNVSRRVVDRMRSSGHLPPHNLTIRKAPRWKAATIRSWIDAGGKGGGR
jgi:hypothetical protein